MSVERRACGIQSLLSCHTGSIRLSHTETLPETLPETFSGREKGRASRFKAGARTATFVVLVLGLVGCSTSQARKSQPQIQRSEMKVSVQSDGRPVSAFEQSLVARIELRSEDVARIAAQEETPLYLFIPVRDHDGVVYGIRVATLLSRSNPLRLMTGDIVTAVGRLKTTIPGEFPDIWRQYLHESMVTMTLEREGRPQKLLFYLPE